MTIEDIPALKPERKLSKRMLKDWPELLKDCKIQKRVILQGRQLYVTWMTAYDFVWDFCQIMYETRLNGNTIKCQYRHVKGFKIPQIIHTQSFTIYYNVFGTENLPD